MLTRFLGWLQEIPGILVTAVVIVMVIAALLLVFTSEAAGEALRMAR